MNAIDAVFFDRDGTLNVDFDYVYEPSKLQWMPGAKEAIAWLNAQGILALVVTNQSGIARGAFTMDDFERFMQAMQDSLAEVGARLDGWYVCPHHPTKGSSELTTECDCRKPRPGLLWRALAERSLDPSRCLMIGDAERDIAAGTAAGIASFLYTGGRLDSELQRLMERVESETRP